jgi:hypothetical protein
VPAEDSSRLLVVAAVAQHASIPRDSVSVLDYAAIGIAAVSLVVTLVVGLLNRATAKRALGLAARQEARREARLELHVEESRSWRRPTDAARVLGFRIVVRNPTDRGNSVVGADVHLTYRADEATTTVKVPCARDVSALDVPEHVGPINLAARVDANDALSGWLIFVVPNGLTHRRAIEYYEVVVRDVHGTEEAFQLTWLQEASDDEAG